MQGKTLWFDKKKGYGFIEGEDGGKYFVHFSDILADGYKKLEEGEAVEFELADSEKGKKAVQVKPV